MHQVEHSTRRVWGGMELRKARKMAENDVEVAVPRWAATPVLVATKRLASTMIGPNTGVLPVTGSSCPPTSSGWFAERSIITNANSSSKATGGLPHADHRRV